jgi:hypothetical protein
MSSDTPQTATTKRSAPVSRNNAVAWPSEMSRRCCFSARYSDGRVDDEAITLLDADQSRLPINLLDF